MEARISAIIINNNKILLINRYKKEKGHYYVLPGGKVEVGETDEETLAREVQEETSLRFANCKKVYEFVGGEDDRRRAAFFLEDVTGKPKLGGPEARKNNSDNEFILEWISLGEIQNINLKPDEHKQFLAMVIQKRT